MTHTLIEVLAPLALAAGGLAYARRCLTLSTRGQPVAAWRQACFGTGLLIVLLADPPPPGAALASRPRPPRRRAAALARQPLPVAPRRALPGGPRQPGAARGP